MTVLKILTHRAVSKMGWVWLVQEEEEEEVAPRQEKMVFTVKLTQFDAAKKVQLIKAIKSLIPNMNLVQVRQSLSVCVFNVQCCFTSTETIHAFLLDIFHGGIVHKMGMFRHCTVQGSSWQGSEKSWRYCP